MVTFLINCCSNKDMFQQYPKLPSCQGPHPVQFKTLVLHPNQSWECGGAEFQWHCVYGLLLLCKVGFFFFFLVFCFVCSHKFIAMSEICMINYVKPYKWTHYILIYSSSPSLYFCGKQDHRFLTIRMEIYPIAPNKNQGKNLKTVLSLFCVKCYAHKSKERIWKRNRKRDWETTLPQIILIFVTTNALN